VHIPPEKAFVLSEKASRCPIILEVPATDVKCFGQAVDFDLPLLPQDGFIG
jgi:hypothetical protein